MSQPARTLTYYFSFISLYSYIGCAALRELIARRQLAVEYKPVDLMAVFAATGGLPVRERAPARQAYRLVEMQRWRAARGIPLVLRPKYYPADPSRGHRMLLAALREGLAIGGFADAALRAVWAEERDIADPETLVALADANGLDGRRLLAASDDPALAASAAALTGEAIERKVFGAPFFFWDGEPFWGQDRLEQLEALIVGGRAPIAYADP
jgi:2-hydroxychromene-2-carboxylate isomerase